MHLFRRGCRRHRRRLARCHTQAHAAARGVRDTHPPSSIAYRGAAIAAAPRARIAP